LGRRKGVGERSWGKLRQERHVYSNELQPIPKLRGSGMKASQGALADLFSHGVRDPETAKPDSKRSGKI
jgi:hypothetical protein